MILVFVVDVSESMSAKTNAGFTLLDLAKSTVEHIVKHRDRGPGRNIDTFLLLTTEEGPESVKATWGDPFTRFEEQLKKVGWLWMGTPADCRQRGFFCPRPQSTCSANTRLACLLSPCAARGLRSVDRELSPVSGVQVDESVSPAERRG